MHDTLLGRTAGLDVNHGTKLESYLAPGKMSNFRVHHKVISGKLVLYGYSTLSVC